MLTTTFTELIKHFQNAGGRTQPPLHCTSLSLHTHTHTKLRIVWHREEVLFTFNAQCPEALWLKDAPLLRAAAASFQLMPLKKELPVRY